jgi:glycosyltransferase involved in cell wall biosynthesis
MCIQKGFNSQLLVLYDSNPKKGVISFCSNFEWKLKNKIEFFNEILLRILLKLFRLFKITYKEKSKYKRKYHFQSYNDMNVKYSTRKILSKVQVKPDYIILYFLDDFLVSKNIYELYTITKAKIYWYLMDMGPLTGGCHYAWDCDGFTKTCGCCPCLKSNNVNDLSNKNIANKISYLSKVDLSFIVASEWSMQQAKKSPIKDRKNIFKLLLSIDTEIYKPDDKILARKYFDLPIDKTIIFIGAQALWDERKGMNLLLEALNILKKRDIDNAITNKLFLLIAGRKDDAFLSNIPFEYIHVGLLDINIQLPKAFQSADFFVCPSIQDAGPMMINQSIMVGVPVVAFEMGVASDLVINEKTGYLAKLKHSVDLANGIYKILQLNNSEYKQMSSNCRELGIKLCNRNMQMNDLLRILEEPLL